MLLIRDPAFEISTGFQNHKLNSPNKQQIAAITTSFLMFLLLIISMKDALDIKAISTKEKDKTRKYRVGKKLTNFKMPHFVGFFIIFLSVFAVNWRRSI